MPTYILLSTLTPEGRQTLHKNPDRLEAVNQEIAEFGCTLRDHGARLSEWQCPIFWDGEPPGTTTDGRTHETCPPLLHAKETGNRTTSGRPRSAGAGPA